MRRRIQIPRWLRGAVSVSPHGTSVRLMIEREYGSVRAELYLTRKQAKELRDELTHIIARTS